jgi:melibiose permease
MNNRSIYKLSLLMAAAGYVGMAIIGYGFGGNVVALGLCYIITSLGTASMFVNQTVMLADIVDYGEFKLGKRNQSLTFSMKGFLQKMAYTMQSIIMYASFALTNYDFSGQNADTAVVTESAKSAISFMMFIVPPAMMLISLVIFSTKFKIHGEYKQKILDEVAKRHKNNYDK